MMLSGEMTVPLDDGIKRAEQQRIEFLLVMKYRKPVPIAVHAVAEVNFASNVVIFISSLKGW